MGKAPKRGSKPTKKASGGKKAVAFFVGTASAPLRVEVRITDPTYERGILADDIDKKRAWFETPADADGWFRFVYSADGPTGDPWVIGKIRFVLDSDSLDPHFANLTGIRIQESETAE